MKRYAFAILLVITLISSSIASASILQNESYITLLRQTADSLLNIKHKANGDYYNAVSHAVYAKAIVVTKTEFSRLNEGPQRSFVKTIQLLLDKLYSDFQQESTEIKKVALPSMMEASTKAALGNFKRYQLPEHLNADGVYRWTMIQVFENLNQINVGLLQAKLSSAQRAGIMKRLAVQQKIIEQLKNH